MTDLGSILEAFWLGMALHLWQTTLFLAVLFAVGLGFRRAPARYADTLAWVALLKFLLPISLLGAVLAPALGVFGVPGFVVAPAALTEYVRVVLEPAALSARVDGSIDVRGFLYVVLTLLWLVGMATLLRRWRRGSKMGSAETFDPATALPAIRARVEAARAGTSIGPNSVRIVRGAGIPSLEGLLRPTILLPQSVVESLGEDELRASLLHEEAHRRRGDTWRALVQRGVLAVFFFYPPVWWLVARLRASAELACDESVLSRGVSPGVYARTLVRVLATQLGMTIATRPTEITMGRPGVVRNRLEHIDNAWRYRAMTRHRVLAAVAVGIIAGFLFAPAILTGTIRPYSESSGARVETKRQPWYDDLDRVALDPGPVLVEFAGEPLSEVFAALERYTNVRFEGAEKLSRRVDVSYGNLTPREVLVRLATAFRLEYEFVDSQTLRVKAAMPLLAGVGGVTNPRLIPSSKVNPVYPVDARADGVEGNVILQAVIRRDGTVGEIEVLRASRPDYPAFEDAAIEAVGQWRYEPAEHEGVPADAYFTIFVDFRLK